VVSKFADDTPEPRPRSQDDLTRETSSGQPLPSRIGRYTVTRKIGEGGMGVVYEAHDDRLDRAVALKTMSSLGNDETARSRFWREARAAARVNHPNICQIYEIGEDGGQLFIAMELLSGQPLSEHLDHGPLSASRVMPIALGILDALSALHAQGIVHRDLKPSNIFATPYGVKLLDFGLARPQLHDSMATTANLTRAGVVVGTPRYMAPEQVTGEPADARSDLFAVGAILFEMLAGRPAFEGRTVIDVLHATVHQQPPALVGSPAVSAMDRVIRRALSKRPADRPASANAMADELRAVHGIQGTDTVALARPLTRIVVLPFRVLGGDEEAKFLAFSLPDAIAGSLSSIDSLVVRSSASAVRFATDAPDLKALAAEADVDRVVMGTLLRSGGQLRASAQLIEAPSGTLLTSHTVQSSMGDLFQLQDEISRRVVDALSSALTRGLPSPRPDVPHDDRAYELYLRANELSRTYDGLSRARDLYERCLELDPGFAPAWAHLGRCHRVIGKYIDGSTDSEALAEAAFSRALELNPRLSVAHKYYANLEADTGRATDAVRRLLGEALRHGNDPQLFAGLVHACRYCGLFDEALAAHAEARRLDPNVPTSLEQTLLMMGEIDRLMAVEMPLLIAGADDGIRVIGMGLAGRRDEARQMLGAMRGASRIPAFRTWTAYLAAWLDRRVEDMVDDRSLGRIKIEDDPEAMFQRGWLLCDVGDFERGFDYIRRAVTKGYYVADTLSKSPQFDALRDRPDFQTLLVEAEQGRTRALAAFQDAGGKRLV
jgi:non-specific serine/threonine protein kinase